MRKFKSMAFCIAFTMLYLGFQVMSGVIIGFINLFLGADKSTIQNTVNNETFLVHILAVSFFIAVVKIYRKIAKKKIWDIEKGKNSPKLWIASIILALSYSVIWSIITVNCEFGSMELIKKGIAYYSGISPAIGYTIMIISVFILAPIGEELLYRRIMICELRRNFTTCISIVISSLIFGIMHIIAGGIILATGAFVMGLILGYIYVSTGGNFSIVVAAHMLGNCADYILMVTPRNMYVPLTIALLIVGIICIKCIYCNSEKRCFKYS